MKFDIEKLYKAAKSAGFTTFESRLTDKEKISIKTFNGEVETFTVAGNSSMRLRGVTDGKCGTFSSDRIDDGVIDEAIAAVKESAEYGQPVDPEIFIKGDEYKYEKLDLYKPGLDEVPTEKIIALCKELETKVRALDKRMNNVEVQYEYEKVSTRIKNSNALDLEHKYNYVLLFVSGDAKMGDEIQSGFRYVFVDDFSKVDIDALAKDYVDYTVGQFGGNVIKSGKYKVVYSQDCFASLLSALGPAFSAFNAEQGISLLADKMGKQVFSEALTVEEKPISSVPFARAFDVEGVPCVNKKLVDKGVPTGFVYDLATAKRAGVKSTGNGELEGSNVRPSIGYVEVEPGKLDLDGLFKFVGDGLYVTSLGGIGTGLDPQSGNYSLQAEGYLIEGGKRGKPVSLITVAGNILDDFKKISAVGSDGKLTYQGVKTPSVVVSEIAVSGK